MKWRGGRQSTNVEDRTNEVTDLPDGEILAFPRGEVYHKPKKEAERDVAVARELGKINREGRNPIPTPNPQRRSGPVDNGSHDNLVTPGKWNTKTK